MPSAGCQAEFLTGYGEIVWKLIPGRVNVTVRNKGTFVHAGDAVRRSGSNRHPCS